MILERAEEIKVIKIGKLKGIKPVSKELKLLDGVNKVDYRQSK